MSILETPITQRLLVIKIHSCGEGGNHPCVQIFEGTAEKRCHVTISSIKHSH